MVVKDAKSFCGIIEFVHFSVNWFHEQLLREMSLLIIDRFWNSTNVQSTILQLPSRDDSAFQKNSLCLSYDTTSLIQLIVALVVLKLVISAVQHLRDCER